MPPVSILLVALSAHVMKVTLEMVPSVMVMIYYSVVNQFSNSDILLIRY